MKSKLILFTAWFAGTFAVTAQPTVYDPLDLNQGRPIVNGFKWVTHTAWNDEVQVTGRGWASAQQVTVKLHGPLNTLGAGPGPDRILSLKDTNGVPLAGTTADGTFRGVVRIPYDDGQIFPGSVPTRIPRPGFYHLVFTGTSSGESAVLGITISPATAPGLLPRSDIVTLHGVLKTNTPERWDFERGGRQGYLGQQSPEAVDPHWPSVWSEEPVAFYGTVVPDDEDDGSPTKVAEVDWLTDHFGHDLNAEITPDPEYQWICATGNKANGFEGNLIYQAVNPGTRQIELEWEHLNGGTPYRFNQRTPSGFFIGCPIFVWPVPGDRVYVVGKWIVDVGHADDGSRAEVHPPRLLATMRRLPTVLPLPGGPSNCLTRASQVDIFISGHGGGANMLSRGLSRALNGGKRIRDVLVKANGLGGYETDYQQMKLYYQAGPSRGGLNGLSPQGQILSYFEFFTDTIPTLIENAFGAFNINVDVRHFDIFPAAGPSAFGWNATGAGRYDEELQPISDMDYEFNVPLPPKPEGATRIFYVATTNWFRANTNGLDSGNYMDTAHETSVREIVSEPWFNPSNEVWFVTVKIPCKNGDGKNYAKTIKFAWDVYSRPGKHYEAHMDYLYVHHDSDPGVSSVSFINLVQSGLNALGDFLPIVEDFADVASTALDLFGKNSKDAEWHLWAAVGNEWRRLNLGPGPMQKIRRGQTFAGNPWPNHKVFGMIDPYDVYVDESTESPFIKLYPAIIPFEDSTDKFRAHVCGYDADDVDAWTGITVPATDGYASAEMFVKALTHGYQVSTPLDSPEPGDNDNLGHAIFQSSVSELTQLMNAQGSYNALAVASLTRPAGEENNPVMYVIQDPGADFEHHFACVFRIQERLNAPHLTISGGSDLAPVNPAAPALTFDPVCVDSSTELTVTCANSGEADLRITAITVTGLGYMPVTNVNWPIIVPKDGKVQVKFRFSRATADQGDGLLTFTSNDPCHGGNLTVPLSVLPPLLESVPAIVGLPAMKSGSSAWGDFDNDGRLDLLMTGTTNSTSSGAAARLLHAIPGGFVDVTSSKAPGLPGVVNGSVAWGDYDNDGLLDFILTGTTDGSVSGAIAQLWRNEGRQFANVTGQAARGLPGVMRCSAAWGDFDHDGHLDFLIAGRNAGGRISQLWRYTPLGYSNVTSQVAPGLPGVDQGSVAWVDYDSDGLLDFILTGTTNGAFSGAIAQLWRNVGDHFINVTSQVAPGLEGVMDSSVAWADYDHDGHGNLLINGQGTNGTTSLQLWRSDGSRLSKDGLHLPREGTWPQLSKGSVAWGDFNNAPGGSLEFLYLGQDLGGAPQLQVWKLNEGFYIRSTNGAVFNNGEPVVFSVQSRFVGPKFADSTSQYFCGPVALTDSSLAVGDYDNDGRLDLLLTGAGANGIPVTRLFRNNVPVHNKPPSAPTKVIAVLNEDSGVTLTWSPAIDDITPAQGLNYNLYIGSSPNGVNVAAPQAEPTNGFRRVVRVGPVTSGTNTTLSYRFIGLPYFPRYFCSVQAIDGDFAGGPFAPAAIVVLPSRTTVTSTRCDGPGSLRDAIAQSTKGGTITFSPALSIINQLQGGTLGNPEPIRISVGCGELVIDKSLKIIGPGPDQLIISGANANRVFHIVSNYPPSVVTISGLTIADGFGRLHDAGGGIRNDGGWLTVSNCVVRDNEHYFGGGIASYATSSRASVTVIDSILSDNISDNDGGSIHAWGTDVTIMASTIRNSLAYRNGGGIYFSAYDGFPSLNGGPPTLRVHRSTVSGNVASYDGDGIKLVGPGEVLQCTFSGNDSGLASTGNLIVSNCTFYVRNYAIGWARGSDGSFAFSHNIFASPDDRKLPAYKYFAYGHDSSGNEVRGTNLGFNLWDDTDTRGLQAVTDVVTNNARLAPLANNGGLTMTHALLPGSPAINAGSGDLALGAGYDQRGPGFPRRVGSRLDIGAIELGAPTLQCPAAIIRNNTIGRCDAAVTFDIVASGPVSCTPPSGSTFPLGQTTVHCTASNLLGSTNCSFNVTVRDTQPPSIQCPTNLTFAASPGVCRRTNVIYSVPVSDNCPGVGLNCSPPSGSDFPIGETTVTCVAFDAANNRKTCSFVVTVQDQQLPEFEECPEDFTINAAPGTNSVVVNFEAESADNCGVAIKRCVPPSGSVFSLGVTPVVCIAFDRSGHSNSCSFSVTVLPGCWPGLTVVNTNDSGPGSLRHALANICSGGTIDFTNSLRGQTILLTSGELVIPNNLNILGLGPTNLTISGNGLSRVFYNPPGVTSVIAGLTIAAGNGLGTIGSGLGGALLNRGTLTVATCAFSGNAATSGGGGAINNNSGILIVENSSLSGNAASASGGGIANIAGGLLTVQNTTLSGNTATNNGGGIHNNNSTLTLLNSTCTGNRALGGAGGGLGASGSEHVTNCIIAGNFRNAEAIAGDIGGSVASGGYNLIGNAGTAGGLTDGVDGNIVGNSGSGTRLIGSILDTNLALNGGPTRTHALLTGSPALDAGTLSSLPNQRFDQRGIGFRRVQSSRLDIGAYELQTPAAFTPIPIAGLPRLSFSSLAWGDYDNDGRLDFLLTGSTNHPNGTRSQLWRNTGAGFVQINVPGLPDLTQGSVAWGDFDNDGRLDFVLTGQTEGLSNAVSQIWRNTGGGFANVTAQVAPALPGVQSSAVAWGDYDNDGRLDLMLTGAMKMNGSVGASIAQIWRNNGGTFSNVTSRVAPGLPPVSASAVAWGDYDSDGQLDFLIIGAGPAGTVAQVWRNTGNAFSNVTSLVASNLPGVVFGSVAWADYDNDGRLDFLLTGRRPPGGQIAQQIAQLWRNTGRGFSNVTAQMAADLRGVERGAATWGDYNNDGAPDFLLTGGTGTDGLELLTQLWRNTGQGFSNVTDELGINLPALQHGSAAWADYDNDGRLDLLLTGNIDVANDGAGVTQLWKNVQAVGPNSPPAAPTGLSAHLEGVALTLGWLPASDAQTAAAGLSYNLVVGTNASAVNIVSPHADVTTGFRRVVRLGTVNAGTNTALTYTFRNLPYAPQYFWSVQALDSAFAGGPFAPVQQVLRPTEIVVTSTGCSGPGSLREAIASVVAGGTITFDPALKGQTIQLSCGELIINKDLTILGLGADQLAISGGPTNRVFHITSNSPPNIVTLAGLTITGGNATSLPSDGGGILNQYGNLRVMDCTVSGNSAHRGGAIFNQFGALTVQNSTLSGNSASVGGAGVFNMNSGTLNALTLRNSTISGNSADTGGGIYTLGTMVAVNSTITGNRAATAPAGGGIYDDGIELLTNCVVAGNFGGTNSTPSDIAGANNVDSASYTLVGDFATRGGIAHGVNGNIVGNNGNGTRPIATILDTNLAFNGGSTRTHALVPGSPAIDAGTNGGSAGLLFDQRGPGFDRVVSGRVDIGAFEMPLLAPAIVCPGDIRTNGVGNAVVVTWPTPVVTGSTPVAIECLPPSGSTFDLGQTQVTCLAANPAGTTTCAFTVAVCASNLVVTTASDSIPGSLRAAIACALPKGTITFAPGLNGQALVLTDGELVLDKSLNILGPGPDKFTVSGNGSSRVFYVAPGTSNLITGLTITRGNGVGAVLNGLGAGILSDGATLTVSNCVLTAHADAAAVHNYATAAGGALRIQNCEISTSRYGIRSEGPGAPDLVIQDSTLVRNGTGLFSGGPAATLLVERSRVISNSVSLLSSRGGGIAHAGRLGIIRFSTIQGNSAQLGGGVYNLAGNGAAGELHLENSTLSGNLAQSGGALYFDADGTSGTAAPVTIENSTLSGNSAQIRGGGIFNVGFFTTAELTLRHCTLSGNTAPTAGGIFNQVNFSGSAVVRLSHTLLAHGAAGGNYFSEDGTITGLGFNLADDATTGAAAANVANLLLAPLADNGGLTLTHALLPGSPALNAGTNGGVAGVPNDQRGPGYPRLLEGAIDIGAYERGASPSLACPANVVTNVADESGTVAVNWILSPGGSPAPAVVCSPSSGASFPIGTTAVICTASNALGRSECGFTVTVCATRLTATTTADDGPGSLRQALLDICPGGTVVFAPALSGQTIELTSGELLISRDLTIEGPGANRLALSGGHRSRVFTVAAGAEVRISGLRVINGRVDSSQRGGGIRNSGVLTLSGCVVRDCEVVYNGANDANAGGIMNEAAGTLTLMDCTVHDNAAYYGAGVYNNGRLTVTESTISGNTAAVFGAGILSWGSATLRFVTFAENHGAGGGSGLQVGGGPVTFEQCLFAANVPKNIDGGGTRTSLGRNISSDGTGNLTAPGDLPNTDPRIGPLGDNGGPTPTHALLPDSPAINVGMSGLPNAWQIADLSTATDSGVLAYTTNLTAAQRFAATNDGWRFSVVNRLVAGSGGASSAHFMIYGNGVRRFVVSWNTNAQGQLTAALTGGPTTNLTAAGADAFAYHTHELAYDPSTRQATYSFDGTTVRTWGGVTPDGNQNGIVQWGAASSAGRGTMNYQRVRFSVEGLGTVAEYRAGLEGNPVVAPNPTTQGWTLTLPATAGAVTNTPVSPDPLMLPVRELVDLDLAYDQRGPGYPRLVGGRADLGAYEWRTIPIQFTCPANVTTNVSDGTDVIAVTWTTPVAISELVPTVTCSPESGSYFPVGPTPVTCTASHGAGLASCTFTITVCASNLTVTSALDSGPGSLRQTIANACAGGTISFDSALRDQTIALLGGELVVNRSLTILGPGADRLVILGDGTNRVLRIASNSPPITVAISDLTLARGGGQGGGLAGRGGAVYNDHAILSLTRSTIRDSVAPVVGGGIYNFGASGIATLTIRDSTLSSNSSFNGGAIFSGGLSGNAALTIRNSTLSGNLATNSGGGIYNYGEAGSATLTLEYSTLASNSSADAVIRNEAGALTINHTLLAKGSSGSNYVSVGGSVVNQGHNLANDNSAGGFATPVANLFLGSLANNGGPTLTHALLPASPAINSGLTSVAADLLYDQRGPGFPRITDGAADIGAYETQIIPITLVCPEDLFASVLEGTNNIVVTWTNPTPVGTPTASVACEPPSGSVFVVGKTIVTCTASNAASRADCSFAVNVCAAHIMVTNVNNNGLGSLRRALVDTCPGGRITFAPGLQGQTIELAGAALVPASDVNIIGPAANLLTISGGGLSRVLRISSGVNCLLSGLTITGGNSSGGGGGILNAGSSLVISDCIITGNSAQLNGGGINHSGGGTLTLHSSSVAGNSSGRFGGALANLSDSTLVMVNSTISGNWSLEDGGAIFNSSGSLLIQHSTVAGNATEASVGGIYNLGVDAIVTLDHTLLAHGVIGANYAGNGRVIDAGFNLSDDQSTEGFATQVLDLMITPLPEFSGSALVHRLLLGSPALDSGTYGPIVGLPFDQRGIGYVRDANGRVDIGAYEMQQPKITQISIRPQGVGLTLKGEPDETLTVEWSSFSPSSGWHRLGEGTTDVSGNLEIIDPAPLVQQRFYRGVRR